MASEMMRQVLDTERACDARLEEAKAAAAETVNAAAKQAESIRREAATEGKQKADAILADAKTKADAITADEKARSDAQIAALRENAAGRQTEAVKKTIVKLLELS